MEYQLARLKRDHPEIRAAYDRGEYPSVRAASIHAGIVKVKTPLDELRSWWKKASEEERETFDLLHANSSGQVWYTLNPTRSYPFWRAVTRTRSAADLLAFQALSGNLFREHRPEIAPVRFRGVKTMETINLQPTGFGDGHRGPEFPLRQSGAVYVENSCKFCQAQTVIFRPLFDRTEMEPGIFALKFSILKSRCL